MNTSGCSQDHVCATGSTLATVSRQNARACSNGDTTCCILTPPPVRKTECLVGSTAAVSAQLPYSVTTLDSHGNLIGMTRDPMAMASDLMWSLDVNLEAGIAGAGPALKLRIQTHAAER